MADSKRTKRENPSRNKYGNFSFGIIRDFVGGVGWTGGVDLSAAI
jgi:hypothetical protein